MVVVKALGDAFFDCAEGGEVHFDEADGCRWLLGFYIVYQSIGSGYVATSEVDVRRVVRSECAHALFA